MIYLASTSPRRKKLLKEAGIAYKTLKPDYIEKNESHIPPAALVKKHALAKAASCISKISEGRILGSDTLVYCDDRIIGKPKDRQDAFEILSQLQGRWHTVYTGVAILDVQNGQIVGRNVFSEKTRVCLKPMDATAIKNYFKKINPMDKAGAYAIQTKQTNIIAEVKGSLSNAIGLPVEQLKKYF